MQDRRYYSVPAFAVSSLFGGPLSAVAFAAIEARALGRLQRDEQLALLRRTIENLPAELRYAFVATVLDGYTYQETAEILSVPVGTVASRVNAARKKVCEAMRKAFPEAMA